MDYSTNTMGTHTKLMTSGSIHKNLISFAIPLSIGTLFQQLYNTADSLVVGNFVGNEALAAISSTAALIFLIVGLFQGIFVGAGVVISTLYGAQDHEGVRKAVHTSVAFALLCSILLTILGYVFAPLFLKWMGTPENVFDDANTYVRIYFLGISALVLYNAATGILQAVGDSKHPLHFLMIASVLNIALDLLLVGYFKLGIAGTAYATIFSQSVSAFLAFRLLFTTTDVVRVDIRKIRFHAKQISMILRIGVPSGIQNSVTSLANVVVQSSINLFGAVAMAGSGSFMRIQGFAFIPVTSFALALTTFTGQNLGARQLDRVKKGTQFGVVFSMILAEAIGLLLYYYAEPLIGLFSRDPAVIAIGVEKAKISTMFIMPLALSHAMAGLFRGAGKSIVPMSVMLACWCIFRVIYIKVALSILMDIRVVFWAYPITWSMSAVIFIIYYFTSDWMGSKKPVK